MSEEKVIDLVAACLSLPEIGCNDTTNDLIERDNYLYAIEDRFNMDYKTVIIDGQDGIGKTTLLVQFANKHKSSSVCIFIKPNDQWGCNIDYLRYDLCNQLSLFINSKELNNINESSEMHLRDLLFSLNKKTRKINKNFYFLVDGLSDIPKENEVIKRQLIQMLPFSYSNIKFIFTGDYTELKDTYLYNIKCSHFILTGFKIEETRKYFEDFDIEDDYIREIHLNCKTLPGRLADIKRLIKSGINVKDLMTIKIDKWSDLFDVEWGNVGTDEEQNKLLSILALDNRTYTVDELSQLICIDKNSVYNKLQGLSFIEFCKETNKITFVTESFRLYAADKLRLYQSYVNKLIVEYMLKKPDSEESIELLPIYLDKSGYHDEILRYLSPYHFLKMLERSQSINSIKNKAELGIKTSINLGKYNDQIRFSIQKSIMLQFETEEILHSEVEAYISLNDYNSAIVLAQSAVTKEDRLHLLSIICKKKKQQEGILDSSLLDLIKGLYNEIDYEINKDKTIAISSELIFCCPEIAIELITKSNKESKLENDLDFAFAELSLRTLEKDQNTDEYLKIADEINSKIKNPEVRDISKSINLLVGGYSASKIIGESEKLKDTTSKLLILTKWTVKNRRRKDAIEVVKYSLDLTIATTSYSPNAQIFRELATPIPYINDEKEMDNLISRFDSQKGLAEKIGPTEEFIGLQLILAHAESRIDLTKSFDRLWDTYNYILELDDLSVKAICMAKLLSRVKVIDKDQELEQQLSFNETIRKDLNNFIEELLNTTAMHFEVSEGIISSLAYNYYDLAYSIAIKLNTETRRNKALSKLIDTLLLSDIKKIDIQFIIKVINEITQKSIKYNLIISILERIESESTEVNICINNALQLIPHVESIDDAEDKCIAYCNLCSILKKDLNSKYENLISDKIQLLEKLWQAMDTGWKKINIGYTIVSKLSTSSHDIAKKLLLRTEEYKKEAIIDSNSLANILIFIIQLAIRAYSGLIGINSVNRDDIKKLMEYINCIPSYGERAALWSDLALRCLRIKELKLFDSLVSENVRAHLAYISSLDKQYYNRLIIRLAPALYYHNRVRALSEIDNLDPLQKDSAYFNIVEYIFTKQSYFDPYDNSGKHEFMLNFDEIIDLCEILKKVETDDLIYYIIAGISTSIYSFKLLTDNQCYDIMNRLDNIINTKLPSKKNIKHGGYKIISKAQVARFYPKYITFEELIGQAKQIDNLADKAFVLSVIATLLPAKQTLTQSALVNDSKSLIDNIPSIYDRIKHYEDFASNCWTINSSLSKKCLLTALQISKEQDNPEYLKVQRRIIDMAHRIDPDLAASMASLTDEDEVRSQVKLNLRQQVKVNDLKKKMTKGLNENEKNEYTNIDYCKAAWKLLGSLNAGRTNTLHRSLTSPYIEVVSREKFMHIYPILSWLVENDIKRHCRAEDSQPFLRNMFDSLLLGAELAMKLLEKSLMLVDKRKVLVSFNEYDDSKIINPGERDLAIEFIRDWLESNSKNNLIIADPFFGPEEMEILKIISSINPSCQINILTSIKHNTKESINPHKLPYDELYTNYWRANISDQDPPDCEITFIGGIKTNEPPIHDRWLITEDSALILGTSFNSLGITKISKLSICTKEQAQDMMHVVMSYLNRKEKFFNGERLRSYSITLY
ncbi:hypothetical protein CLHOM_19170 [Clostridium homopropionicum DSM 5847]|uniref:NACHT domain protein n=1 Tax=Clostridium homopropionicum DSM 5847 TaxID=1121318 RepID=A0A0L6ZAL9_9CLOT|nr:hypothetical protein [Clostridium homopropionicum]KOA19828.1 hypothetical protein CLHOM_19170 [Clostridium homopropionicum DSM 5847]SFF76545.1 hypothetical protein SAMN04488501_10276 [Clostridium homopropionicum]